MAENTIYKQLREAQLELKAPKSETGRFGKSRSAEAILEAAKPVLSRHNLTLLVSDKITEVGDRHYVEATATVFNDTGESVSATANAWEGDVDRGLDASQVTGKTSSYARKYALGGLLAIDDTKDADIDDTKDADIDDTKAKPAAPKVVTDSPATDKQKALIRDKLMGIGIPTEDMQGYLIEQYGITETDKMTKEDASSVIEDLIASAA